MVHTLFSSRAVNFSIPPKTLFTVRSHDWRGRLRWRGLYTRVSIKWEVGYFTVFIFFVGLNDLPGSEKYKYNNRSQNMRLLYIMSFFVFLTRHPREGFCTFVSSLLLYVIYNNITNNIIKFQSEKLLLFPCHY